MSFDFGFLFRKCKAFKFFNSASFLDFHPFQNIFGAPKHHNRQNLSKIYQVGNLKTRHFKLN